MEDQRKKRHKKVSIASNLKNITDMDKILRGISSPFMGESSTQEELVNIFRAMQDKN